MPSMLLLPPCSQYKLFLLRIKISGSRVPRTLDMMARQGFSTSRLGLWTRRRFSGGSRMGLCVPVMMAMGRQRESTRSWWCLFAYVFSRLVVAIV